MFKRNTLGLGGAALCDKKKKALSKQAKQQAKKIKKNMRK
jgi:hypothetical protein